MKKRRAEERRRDDSRREKTRWRRGRQKKRRSREEEDQKMKSRRRREEEATTSNLFRSVLAWSDLLGCVRMQSEIFRSVRTCFDFFANFVGFQRFGSHHMYFVIHL